MTTLAHTSPTDDNGGTRIQTLAGGLALALLVPVLALSGLAVPLPSAVHRLAVDLIERTEALAVGFRGGSSETASGGDTIELTQAEQPVSTLVTRAARSSVAAVGEKPAARRRAAAVLPGGRSSTPAPARARTPASPAGSSGTGGSSTTTTAVGSTPAPTGPSTPAAPPARGSGPDQGQQSDSPGGGITTPAPPAGSTPNPPPTVGETVNGTVGTVGETVETTVGTVGETVETTVGTVGETVDETVGTVEQTVEETVETVEGILGGLLSKPPKKP